MNAPTPEAGTVNPPARNTMLYKTANTLIAGVWLVNGLFCKVFVMTPRHQEIVSKILGAHYAFPLTKLIGISEVFMFSWIVSRLTPKLCAVTQICVIMVMNIIEFRTAPDLLLFGRLNLPVAFVFCTFIYCNEFILRRSISAPK